MRSFVLAVALIFTVACTDAYRAAADADTIEAFEAFLAAEPTSPRVTEATLRLEELYLAKAKEEGTLVGYDAYLKRFPEGKMKPKAMEARESLLFDAAEASNDPAAWQRYLDEYPRGQKELRKKAEVAVVVSAYKDKFTLSEVTSKQVNLAEDPKGELNGWGFGATATNAGPAKIRYAVLELTFLGPNGGPLGKKSWPIAAEQWNTPLPDALTKPMKPGESREWWYTTGDVPKDWSGQVSLRLSQLQFAE